jgi:hypothetical protein
MLPKAVGSGESAVGAPQGRYQPDMKTILFESNETKEGVALADHVVKRLRITHGARTSARN